MRVDPASIPFALCLFRFAMQARTGDKCALCLADPLLCTLRLLTSTCSHRVCEPCVNRLFLAQNVVPCPVCKTTLRRINFTHQTPEEYEMSREMGIRKALLKDFNKREDDFGTSREYDDYLEMVEELVYNLVNGMDVERTQERIEEYRKRNQHLIHVNQSKKAVEEKEVSQRIAEEEQERERRRKQLEEEKRKDMEVARETREAVLAHLERGRDPEEIKREVATRRAERNREREEKRQQEALEAEKKKETPSAQPPAPKPPVPSFTSYTPGVSSIGAPSPWRPSMGGQTPWGSGLLATPASYVQPSPLVAPRGNPRGEPGTSPSPTCRSYEEAYEMQLRASLASRAGGHNPEWFLRRSLEEATGSMFLD